jgi:CRP-like cAMP-binding protein
MMIKPPTPTLKLTLESKSLVPSMHHWRVSDGYIRTNTWSSDGDVVTVGLAGPGDLLPPLSPDWQTAERVCLTRTLLVEATPSQEDLAACLHNQIDQTISLLRIGRLRPVDTRLLHLLNWIGTRFGIVNSRGTLLSLQEMNLTHRVLAELCGTTRVSITKSLSRYKTAGTIVMQGDLDLLLPHRHPALHHPAHL